MLCKLIEEFESRNIAVCVIGADTGTLLTNTCVVLI